MFLLQRLLSPHRGHAPFLLAAVIFALGLGVGANIHPLTASRSMSEAPPLVVSPAIPREVGAIRGLHPVEVLRVLDGDTFEARVNLWPGLDITTRVRLRGIDAPELKARCNDERVKAEAAREALRTILNQGEVGISNVTLDKYGGRVVADASTRATPDILSVLLSVGAARRYSGGHRDGWCP